MSREQLRVIDLDLGVGLDVGESHFVYLRYPRELRRSGAQSAIPRAATVTTNIPRTSSQHESVHAFLLHRRVLRRSLPVRPNRPPARCPAVAASALAPRDVVRALELILDDAPPAKMVCERA